MKEIKETKNIVNKTIYSEALHRNEMTKEVEGAYEHYKPKSKTALGMHKQGPQPSLNKEPMS